MKPFEFRNFDYSGWDRPEHTILKDPAIKAAVQDKGYHIIPNFISPKEVEELLAFYNEHHSIDAPDGGFFISINSSKLDYRQATHEKIKSIINDKLEEKVFHNHKHTVFTYFVKYPGKKGEMLVHQDMAQVDEYKYSQVGIWMPLQDVGVHNGTLGILPYSYKTIPPHRTLYHKLPFSNLYPLVYRHMQPLTLKAGDLAIFDIRTIHNSFVNLSDHTRIAVASSAVPKEAPFRICYRSADSEEKDENGCYQYDFIEVDDNFFLEFKDFKSEKVVKPEGNSTTKVSIKEAFVEEDEFLEFLKVHNIKPHDNESYFFKHSNIPLQEPDEIQESEPEPVLMEENSSDETPKKRTILTRIREFINGN